MSDVKELDDQKGGDLSDKIREIISGKKNLDYWLGKLSMDTIISEFKDAANFCVAVHNLILEMQEQLTAIQQALDSAVEALKLAKDAMRDFIREMNGEVATSDKTKSKLSAALIIAKTALTSIKE